MAPAPRSLSMTNGPIFCPTSIGTPSPCNKPDSRGLGDCRVRNVGDHLAEQFPNLSVVRLGDVEEFAVPVTGELAGLGLVDFIGGAAVVNQHVARRLGLRDAVDLVRGGAAEFGA